MARLERLRAPVVAAIHGACLGAGLETALACAYRIASDHPKTVLGAARDAARADSRRGRHAAAAEGRRAAGRARHDPHREERAREEGAADGAGGRARAPVDPARDRDRSARRSSRAGTLRAAPRACAGRRWARCSRGTPLGRAVVFRQARAMTLKKSRGAYPALLAAIDAVEAGLSRLAGARIRDRGAALRRDGGDRGVARADLPVLRDDVAQEGHRRDRRGAARRCP